MKKYEFKIAPAYSLYRGVSVGWQKGSAVMFLAERKLEEGVENLLKLAFEDYVRFVNNQLDCPKEFRADCRVMFMYVSKFRIRDSLFRKNLKIRSEFDERKSEIK